VLDPCQSLERKRVEDSIFPGSEIYEPVKGISDGVLLAV
jgi:hypothetical protein